MRAVLSLSACHTSFFIQYCPPFVRQFYYAKNDVSSNCYSTPLKMPLFFGMFIHRRRMSTARRRFPCLSGFNYFCDSNMVPLRSEARLTLASRWDQEAPALSPSVGLKSPDRSTQGQVCDKGMKNSDGFFE